MHVTLLGIAESVREQLERGLQAQGLLEGCHRHYASSLKDVPPRIAEGLVVVEDPGRSLGEVEELCRELHSRRSVLRTHLVLLTQRAMPEQRALIQAGVDECAAPPGGDWLARMTALSRRLVAMGVSSPMPAIEERSSERLSLRSALQAVLESTRADLGYLFFSKLVEHLARTYRASCVLVGELLPDQESIRTLAFWLNGSLQRGVIYSLSGTPCDVSIRKAVCHVRDGVAERFPEDEMLEKLGMRGYLGAPQAPGDAAGAGRPAVLHRHPGGGRGA